MVAQVRLIRAAPFAFRRRKDSINPRWARLFSAWMTRAAALVLCLGPLTCWSDQWVTGVTPALINAADSGGTNGEYILLAPQQAVQNPANCPSPSAYVLRDPVINKDTLAILLTAYTSGTNVQVYLSSTLCDTPTGRPLITQVGLN